jgi:branched-chain amino acid transport system ATP-binding protein
MVCSREQDKLAEALLEVQQLVKCFGSMMVSAHIDLTVVPGEIHAVIGPNGAGKTTLIAQLSGDLQPDAGKVNFAGIDITRMPVHKRSQLGIARSFQITSIFHKFSVLDNVALAFQAKQGHNFRFWRNARRCKPIYDSAFAVLESIGLAQKAGSMAGNLSHGEQRQLEIAMVLGTRPKLLLLDEPMAGLGAEESEQMVAILRSLKSRHAMLLVEHDMDAVFTLADRVTVLVYGRVLASGKAEAIRSNPEVCQAYLGDAEACAINA